ncbi:hypothetical protein J7L68_01350 [bacterium]|nr:hypothetical protein [bacterium]
MQNKSINTIILSSQHNRESRLVGKPRFYRDSKKSCAKKNRQTRGCPEILIWLFINLALQGMIALQSGKQCKENRRMPGCPEILIWLFINLALQGMIALQSGKQCKENRRTPVILTLFVKRADKIYAAEL